MARMMGVKQEPSGGPKRNSVGVLFDPLTIILEISVARRIEATYPEPVFGRV